MSEKPAPQKKKRVVKRRRLKRSDFKLEKSKADQEKREQLTQIQQNGIYLILFSILGSILAALLYGKLYPNSGWAAFKALSVIFVVGSGLALIGFLMLVVASFFKYK